MRNETTWWVIGLLTFFLVFFPGLTLVVLVCLAPLGVACLGGAAMGKIIDCWLNDTR